MAFRQQHRPQSSRQLSYHQPTPAAQVSTASSPQRKQLLEKSEEWVLFSPVAASTSAHTHTTSTEQTPRTTGLSRFSDFGSLDTAAYSDHEAEDDDNITRQGTEDGEELDSLDDGLHAFHEPSEYAGITSKVQQSGDTVLPTHDGLGTFRPDDNVQEHMWQFERQSPRRRQARRRSSVQRRFDALEEAETVDYDTERRQRIEQWRLEQSRALMEEIERETRRRRRLSTVSAARSRSDSVNMPTRNMAPHAAESACDGHSESSDESTENLSFWQRLTRRVIRDLMGIDEDTLSVIFGEALPEESSSIPTQTLQSRSSIDATLQTLDVGSVTEEDWQHRLLERVARELGILVHQLSEHPGAFATYRLSQEDHAYAGLPSVQPSSELPAEAAMRMASSATSSTSPTSAHFAPTYPAHIQTTTYSEASLWGIEEEAEPTISSDPARSPPELTAMNAAEDLAREQEYWERELDVKMVFNFLVKRFSSRRPSASYQQRQKPTPPISAADSESASARRAAIIRQNHPLVNRARDQLPTSSTQTIKRKDLTFKTYYHHPPSMRSQVLKSSSSCASQSTKKSKRSAGSGRNYWDMGGSVGSGSVIAGEV